MKLALKIFLTITFPLWAVPVALFVAGWDCVGDIIEDEECRTSGLPPKRRPRWSTLGGKCAGCGQTTCDGYCTHRARGLEIPTNMTRPTKRN